MSHPDAIRLLFDFSNPAEVAVWRAIDDRVMGGVSSSGLRHDPAGHAIFEGTVSLERNGGFASIRSRHDNLGKTGAQTCFIEARATGKRFKLNLLNNDAFDSINHQASFTPGPAWQTLHIPLACFRATFRGREVPGAPALEPARIRQVGLMIADRHSGPFALEVRRIGLA